MILKKITIQNLKGIQQPICIDFREFNVVVGQNDAGKSTLLKALDLFLNDKSPKLEDLNNKATSSNITIELAFLPISTEIVIDEVIPTTFEDEEIVDVNGYFVIKKEWDVSKSKITAETSILRKKYDEDDFLLETEVRLIALCKKNGIETQKANNEEYNNREKRTKLREVMAEKGFSYVYEIIPSSGKSRLKSIGDEAKKVLPSFEYFKADTSLSENETAIQNFFKKLSEKAIKEELDTEAIEDTIQKKLSAILEKITQKINQVVETDEAVTPSVNFDWSKLISTTFKSKNDDGDIPLSSRGDGFRRITMMAYFEHLAEQDKTERQNIIFGFEEPETFLHPSAQEKLLKKLLSMRDNGYQIIISTHSPIIVSHTDKADIVHVKKSAEGYSVEQNLIDILGIAHDLGISIDNQFVNIFDKAKVLLLVEGIDDANIFSHVSQLYKDNNLIQNDFEDLEIAIIPVGGCDSIKHWVTLDLLTKLGKPYFIFQDSDKEHEAQISPNFRKLSDAGFQAGVHFQISKKRNMENYIPAAALNRIVEGADLTYGDWDNVKKICAQHPLNGQLGGKHVCDRHFKNLTFDEIRSSFFDGAEDEFLVAYNNLNALLVN